MTYVDADAQKVNTHTDTCAHKNTQACTCTHFTKYQTKNNVILTSSFLTGNLCLNYLANQPNEVYVTQSLTRLLVKVVKLGWFESVNEEHVFRKTIDDVQLFLKVSH